MADELPDLLLQKELSFYANKPKKVTSQFFERPKAPVVFTSMSGSLDECLKVEPQSTVHRLRTADSFRKIGISRSRSFSPEKIDTPMTEEHLDSILSSPSTSDLSSTSTFSDFTSDSDHPPPVFLLSAKKPFSPLRKIKASSVARVLDSSSSSRRRPSEPPPRFLPIDVPLLPLSPHLLADFHTIAPCPSSRIIHISSPPLERPRMSESTLSLSLSLKTPRKKSAFSKPSSLNPLSLGERERILYLQNIYFAKRMSLAYKFLNDRRRGIPLHPTVAATMIQRSWRAYQFRSRCTRNLLKLNDCITSFKDFIRSEHTCHASITTLLAALTPSSASHLPRNSPFSQLVHLASQLQECFSVYIDLFKTFSVPIQAQFVEQCCNMLCNDILPLLQQYRTIFPGALLAFGKLLLDDKKFSRSYNTGIIKQLLPAPLAHYNAYAQRLAPLIHFSHLSQFQRALTLITESDRVGSP